MVNHVHIIEIYKYIRYLYNNQENYVHIYELLEPVASAGHKNLAQCTVRHVFD